MTRTIADLAGSEGIRAEHLAEAISYRNLDGSSSGDADFFAGKKLVWEQAGTL